jgi:hypothetical protein
VFVALGGLHVASLPDEAAPHADAIFLGPGEQTFPAFLKDFRAGRPQRLYASKAGRTLERVPAIRRDLIRRTSHLAPNSIVVFRPARLQPEALKQGYDWAYREFYRWLSMAKASLFHGSLKHQAKHFFYAAGWKKFAPLWNVVIRAKQLRMMTPVLEAVLSKVTGSKRQGCAAAGVAPTAHTTTAAHSSAAGS